MNEINRIPPWPSLSFMIFSPQNKKRKYYAYEGASELYF